MRAVCLKDDQVHFESDHRANTIDRGLIEVEVLTAGICETDLQLKQGYMGFQGVLGHEFVGIPTSGDFAGQRVVGEINCSCLTCQYCTAGLTRHCPNRSVIGILNHDGAFADRVMVPQENLHLVPDDMPTNCAVFTEPVAAACRISEQVSIKPDHRVIVLGDGRLGNLCAQVIRAEGNKPLVVGKHEWKLSRLRQLDIETTLLEDFQPASDAHFVVDCTGSPSGIPLALQAVRPCGTIIQKTTVAAPLSIHMAPVVIDEVKIVGSRCGPFAPALKLLHSGEVQVEAMVSAEYPLEDATTAFAHAEQPDTLKILFNVSD